MALSIGGFVNRVLDKFLPDIVGDVVGGAIDSLMGNTAGAVMNFADALMDIVAYMGGEEFAEKGMEVLEGMDVAHHIENAISGGGEAPSAPAGAAVPMDLGGIHGGLVDLGEGLSVPTSSLDGGYLNDASGGYLQ